MHQGQDWDTVVIRKKGGGGGGPTTAKGSALNQVCSRPRRPRVLPAWSDVLRSNGARTPPPARSWP